MSAAAAPAGAVAPFASEWTMPRTGVDFSSFWVPTPEDAPWGEDAVVTHLTLTVTMGEGARLFRSRSDVPVTFDRTTGSLVRRADGDARRTPEMWLGLRSLVNLRVATRESGARGLPEVTVIGRCYGIDDGRLEGLMRKALEGAVRARILAARNALGVVEGLSEPEGGTDAT